MPVETGKVSSKGQVVIPARLRKKHKIKGGTRVNFTEMDDRIVMTPLTSERLRKLRGVWKDGPSVTEFLLKERKKDRLP